MVIFCIITDIKLYCIIWFYIVICIVEVLCYFVTARFFLKPVRNADGDPQWWVDIRQAVSEEDTRHLLEIIMEDEEAPLRKFAAK